MDEDEKDPVPWSRTIELTEEQARQLKGKTVSAFEADKNHFLITFTDGTNLELQPHSQTKGEAGEAR